MGIGNAVGRLMAAA